MGGNLFKDSTEKIKKEWIDTTLEKYFNELKRIFPTKSNIFNKDHFITLGSVGKKPYSGDIDLGIDYKDIFNENKYIHQSALDWGIDQEFIKKKFHQYKKKARTSTDDQLWLRALLTGIVNDINSKSNLIIQNTKKITFGSIFGIFPQFNEKGIQQNINVQIDWLISDLPMLKFAYYSDSYKGNVKGLHRTQLIIALFQALDISFSHVKGITNKNTGQFITKDPEKIVKILEEKLNTKLPKDIINNYFKLMNIVLNNIDSQIKNKALDEYFKILDSTRADIPENIQNIWLERKSKLGLTGKFLPSDSKLLLEIK